MRSPDITGRAARAWKIEIPPDAPTDWQASLRTYLVNGEGFHPHWTWWRVGMSHLRDIPGVKPAVKHYAGAEYEFMIAAIDPSYPPDVEAKDGGYRIHLLSPIDVVVQFDGLTDDQAARLCMMAATIICRGQASPDQDYRSWWEMAIRNAVQHELMGGHPPRGQA